MADHDLDRPVWNALSSVHAGFSIGSAHARRFHPDVNPLGAARDESAESLTELGNLIGSAGSTVIAQAVPIVCPPGTRATMTAPASQMLFDKSEPPGLLDVPIVPLGEDDAPAMMALAALTRPGPFGPRTRELGEYWGIKDNGRLVAMAGERLKQPGYTEVSGVCTHPDHQGRGYGRALCLMLVNRIISRGEQAYLHVYASNTPARALYAKLGFRERRQMHVAQLEPV